MNRTDTRLRVVYLVSQYPAPSHVFIEREIQGLRALGVEVDMFSVRPTAPELLLDEKMEAEAASTTVIQSDRRGVAADVATLLRTEPVSFLRSLRRALGTGERTLRSRTWQGFYFAEAVRLHAEMQRRGLRHVHVHFANNSADIARLAVAIGRGVDGPDAGWRWSFSMHGPTEFEAVDRFDLAAKVEQSDGVACISDFARSQLMRLTAPEMWAKLSIVRMSVDLDTYGPPEVARAHDGPIRVLSVGRLVAEKGAPILVDAVTNLRRLGVELDVRLVGGGELEPMLRERVARAGLDDVIQLTGPLGQDRLLDLYRWADIFCLPSFQEGLPVVLMEAMATELPVVTTAIAGIPELVENGVTGRVVPAGRADLVAEAIRGLAQDPQLRAELGRRGRAKVEAEFSLAAAACDQFEFLRSVRPGQYAM